MLLAKEWPKGNREEPPRDTLEERGPRADVLDSISTPSASLIDVTTFISASRLNRTTAWMFCFLHNVRSTEKRWGPQTTEEIQGMQANWLKEAQRSAFAAELRRATYRIETPSTSLLRDFSTFIDQASVLSSHKRSTPIRQHDI